jgi:hypothetical protein
LGWFCCWSLQEWPVVKIVVVARRLRGDIATFGRGLMAEPTAGGNITTVKPKLFGPVIALKIVHSVGVAVAVPAAIAALAQAVLLPAFRMPPAVVVQPAGVDSGITAAMAEICSPATDMVRTVVHLAKWVEKRAAVRFQAVPNGGGVIADKVVTARSAVPGPIAPAVSTCDMWAGLDVISSPYPVPAAAMKAREL